MGMKLLHIINGSLKKNIQKQTEQIKLLQSDNFDLKQEVEKYKELLADKNKETENERIDDMDDMKVKEVDNIGKNDDNVDIKSLQQQISALKEELDETRHKLLQYQIFDQNSELDIDIETLLSSVDKQVDNDVKNDDGDEKMEKFD